MNNIKFRRICAYIIDYTLITILASLISQIQVINPYYDEYSESYEVYQDIASDVSVDNAAYLIKSNEYIDAYYNVYKYGVYINLISVVSYLLYFVGFQKWNKGQSLGKKMFHLQVVNEHEEVASWSQFLLRTLLNYNLLFTILILILSLITKGNTFFNIAMVISVISYIWQIILILTILFRKDNLGAHDFISKTKVIDAK